MNSRHSADFKTYGTRGNGLADKVEPLAKALTEGCWILMMAALYRQRQRRRTDWHCDLALDPDEPSGVALHRTGKTDPERLHREPQRPLPGRMPH